MIDHPDAVPGSPGDPPEISSLAVAGLRLSGAIDVGQIAEIALDALVPGFADAAVLFALEHLLRGGGPVGPQGTSNVAVRRVGVRYGQGGGEVSHEAFPAGEVVVIAPDSDYAQCMRTGQAASFTWPDTRALEHAGAAGKKALFGYASFLTVPMTSRGTSVGFLVLARVAGRPPFGGSTAGDGAAGDIAAVAALAAHAGTGIANAVLLRRYRSISDALQRGLLAAEPPRPALLEMGGQCLPAAGNLVGGDWYDIIPLPRERTGLVVGDVMGHGAEAAAIMAQLRAAARALAQLDLEPAELLRQLGRTAVTLPGLPLATCAYAVIDPAGQSCTIAAAGHLPPVLALPDHLPRALDLPSGPSLGLGVASYGQARIKLPPGAVIALFTDGLVETRTRSFEQGIRTLRTELARATGTPDAICGTLIDALASDPEDDVTLILTRIPSAGA